ncbi:MAG: L-rhamnose mutarotase [Mangrovibacterium sp.]
MTQRVNYKIVLLLVLLAACQPKGSKQSVDTKASVPVDRFALELILDDPGQTDSLANKLRETPFELYRWKNHLVLFGATTDSTGIAGKLRQSDFKLKIKKYDRPIYVFDRGLHCGDSLAAKPWRNYLLTANLVADTAKQNEYVHDHAVQFDEYPEVAQGFCHAGFQQLIVFCEGRQLMLVISIPGDKTLDELNPKTVEDNPRMVEWNKRMSRYQEGIEGTAPGETWVFLESVDKGES